MTRPKRTKDPNQIAKAVMGREAMMAMIDDALAEFHDPASAAQFCVDWLKDMGVPPMVSIPVRAPATDGKAV